MKCVIIVLDSVGIGEAPDAAEYGDTGANTLAHIADAVGGLDLPVLQSLGLGNIPLLTGGPLIRGVAPVPNPRASFGAMREVSRGKDTTTGHWEMAGLKLSDGFHIFPPGPPSFPPDLVSAFEQRTGRKLLGNKAASGLAIIEEFGARQMAEGAWIVYTSADSVFQIAANEEVIPLDELYEACRTARELCNPYKVGRIIARPFVGSPGSFRRTENRHDFSYPLPAGTTFHSLAAAGIHTITIGKLDDIFTGAPISKSVHMENNRDAQNALLNLAETPPGCFIFANLIDFDMLYGHRRDPAGYARALTDTDRFLETFITRLADDDIVFITADHGNDPTFKGSDHTREYVPLLAFSPGRPVKSIGIRHGFYDLAQTVAALYKLPRLLHGEPFIS